MRRRRLAGFALVTILGVAAGCDTNDGREMQPPDSFARFQLASTTPSTTSTVAPPPTEATTSTTSTSSSTTSTSPTSTSTSVSETDPGATPDSAVLSGLAGSPAATQPVGPAEEPAAGAEALGFPDLADAGVEFTAPWEPGAAIDVAYSCDGEGVAPLLTWTAPPEGTAELALTVIDEDADGYVHWLVIGLPAAAGSVGGDTSIEVGAEATNSNGGVGWFGPCPPEGDDAHTYRFTLHALSQASELPADAPADDLLASIDASTMAVATFTGTYQRA